MNIIEKHMKNYIFCIFFCYFWLFWIYAYMHRFGLFLAILAIYIRHRAFSPRGVTNAHWSWLEGLECLIYRDPPTLLSHTLAYTRVTFFLSFF